SGISAMPQVGLRLLSTTSLFHTRTQLLSSRSLKAAMKGSERPNMPVLQASGGVVLVRPGTQRKLFRRSSNKFVTVLVGQLDAPELHAEDVACVADRFSTYN